METALPMPPCPSRGGPQVPVGQFHPGVLKTVSDALALACWLPANKDKKASELRSAAITLFGCELVEAARSEWRAQPAQVVESIGCEGVTAALDDIRAAIRDASRLGAETAETFPKLTRLAYESLLKAHDAVHVITTQWDDRDPNARWLTLAHSLCADAGVPSGHIADRLEGLRKVLESRA